MDTTLIAGFGFVILAALANGAFALPQKFVKNFAWENTWGSFWFFAMLIIPTAMTPLLCRDVFATWSAAGLRIVVVTFSFGLLWGLGAITFGIGISTVGLSLGFTIIMGLIAGVGSIVPFVMLHSERVNTPAGYVIILGILTCIAGVAVSGYAGVLKERNLAAKGETQDGALPRERSIVKGMLVCALAGLLSACMNLGYSFAGTITRLAQTEFGNPVWSAGLAAWLLMCWGAFATSGFYSVRLLFKNSTWNNFGTPGATRNLLLTGTMGILHFGGMLFYGIGAHHLGELGTSVGYAALISFSILIANALGFITGEWRGVSRKSVNWMIAGLAVLVLGVCILGKGNSMLSTPTEPTPQSRG